MQITNQTTIAELALHPNPIISRHALGILKEARRNIDTPTLQTKAEYDEEIADQIEYELTEKY